MVFQNCALYPHKTVAENMSFALELRNTSKSEIDSWVRRAAEILVVTPYLAGFPRQLSGGRRRRGAMGRTIMRDPRAINAAVSVPEPTGSETQVLAKLGATKSSACFANAFPPVRARRSNCRPISTRCISSMRRAARD
jgi:ABC-type ATPase involved in cell division